MPRDQFDHDLQQLKDDLLLMASMAAQAIRRSIKAMQSMDEALAQQIIADDAAVNKMRFALEDSCLTLIATQQPMARDMRLIAGVLEISGELERIGDYGKGIARIVLLMEGKPPIKPLIDLPRMAEIALVMLDRAMEAFVAGDAAEAAIIPNMDDEVDALYNQVNRELLTVLMVHPGQMEQANYLLWAAHNLERCADRVTNICERVIYTVTGEFREIDAEEFGFSGVH